MLEVGAPECPTRVQHVLHTHMLLGPERPSKTKPYQRKTATHLLLHSAPHHTSSRLRIAGRSWPQRGQQKKGGTQTLCKTFGASSPFEFCSLNIRKATSEQQHIYILYCTYLDCGLPPTLTDRPTLELASSRGRPVVRHGLDPTGLASS